MKGDWEKVDDVNRTWDRIIDHSTATPYLNQPLVDPKNPYQAQEIKTPLCAEDENLLVSFGLLSTKGFESPLGRMMAEAAETILPQTIKRCFQALDHARSADNIESLQLKEELRGMIATLYAWGYVVRRTGQLQIRDLDIYPALLDFAATEAGSPARQRMTASAENRLENITGTFLQIIDEAKKQTNKPLRLFYTGALMMLYVLANLAYGYNTNQLIEKV